MTRTRTETARIPLDLAMSLLVADGLVEQVLVVGNPDKLAGLSLTGSGTDLGSGA
jgi:hypothetical protein